MDLYLQQNSNYFVPVSCRTCSEYKDKEVYVNVTRKCHFNRSVKDIIIMLVPQMAETLLDTHSICETCFNIIANCIKFIEKCLETEKKLKVQKEILHCNYSDYEEVLPALKIAKSNIQVVDEAVPLKLKGDLYEDHLVINDDSEGSLSQDHIITNDTKNAEDLCSRRDYFTNNTNADDFGLLDNIAKHNRIISLEQSSSEVLEGFISKLTQSGVNVLRVSNDPETAITRTEKRVLLLGTHIFNMAYKCPKCSKCLQNRQKFNAHILTCNKNPPNMEDEELMNCIFCDRNLKKKHMETHLKRHEQRVEQKRSKLALAKEKKEHEKRTLQCRTCFERFTSKEDYQIHLEIHPPYICDKCGKAFTQSASLCAHKKCHNEPNSCICEVCGKGYKEKGMLRVHMQSHENSNFKCPMCSKIFKNKVRVQRHIKSVHNTGFSHQCARCGKLFKKVGSHNAHVRLVHMKMRPYTCKICDKQFGRSDYLQRHIMSHTGEPNVNNSNATRGRRLNTKIFYNKTEPPSISCKFCGKWFLGIPKLKLHLETHVKIRRFPCQFCPLTFARKQICKRHELSHKNWENFYRCNICWRRLTSKEDLDAHVETKHTNPRYPCDICGKKFHRMYLLNHHNLLEHRTPEDTEKAKQIVYDSLLEIFEAE